MHPLSPHQGQTPTPESSTMSVGMRTTRGCSSQAHKISRSRFGIPTCFRYLLPPLTTHSLSSMSTLQSAHTIRACMNSAFTVLSTRTPCQRSRRLTRLSHVRVLIWTRLYLPGACAESHVRLCDLRSGASTHTLAGNPGFFIVFYIQDTKIRSLVLHGLLATSLICRREAGTGR